MMVPAISSWAAAVSLLCFIYIYIYLYIYIEKEKKSFQYEFVGYEIVGYENDGFSLLVSVIWVCEEDEHEVFSIWDSS